MSTGWRQTLEAVVIATAILLAGVGSASAQADSAQAHEAAIDDVRSAQHGEQQGFWSRLSNTLPASLSTENSDNGSFWSRTGEGIRNRGPRAAMTSWCPRTRGMAVSSRNQRRLKMFKTMLIGAIVSAALALGAHASVARDDAAEISKNANAALQSLYSQVAGAKALGAQAHAILVFPRVTKAGLGIGGQSGEGALLKDGKTIGYYRTSGASFGLQAGAQTYGYAMFFMNAKALAQLDAASGFEVGVGPSVVIMDEGMAKSTTTTTMKEDIYALIFGQKGLMAGLGIQGNKISKINPK